MGYKYNTINFNHEFTYCYILSNTFRGKNVYQ